MKEVKTCEMLFLIKKHTWQVRKCVCKVSKFQRKMFPLNTSSTSRMRKQMIRKSRSEEERWRKGREKSRKVHT